MAPAGRRQKRAPTTESYLFAIESFEPHYSFTTNDGLPRPGRYAEYLQPQIQTVCLAPAKLAGRATRFVLIGDRDVADAEDRRSPRERAISGSVGTLTMRGARSEYLGALPFDALLALGPMLAAQNYRRIYLSGGTLYRGTADIRSIGFYADFDISEL